MVERRVERKKGEEEGDMCSESFFLYYRHKMQ
jgi:hypothetical protein